MTRLPPLALVALALLAACGPRPSGLSPDAAFQASLAAAERGEVPRALALLREAADAGHLGALALRAEATRRGYLRTADGGRTPGPSERTLSFLVLPGEAEAAQNAYARALRRAASKGDPDARLRLALDLARPRWIGGEWATPDADRDSARALYRSLAAGGAAPGPLAALARLLGDEGAYAVHLDAAAAAGDARACRFRAHAAHRDRSSAARFSAFADAVEACPPVPGHDPLADDVRALRRQARSGNAAAVALLDSVRAGGLFRRHPRLAASGP